MFSPKLLPGPLMVNAQKVHFFHGKLCHAHTSISFCLVFAAAFFRGGFLACGKLRPDRGRACVFLCSCPRLFVNQRIGSETVFASGKRQGSYRAAWKTGGQRPFSVASRTKYGDSSTMKRVLSGLFGSCKDFIFSTTRRASRSIWLSCSMVTWVLKSPDAAFPGCAVLHEYARRASRRHSAALQSVQTSRCGSGLPSKYCPAGVALPHAHKQAL